MTLRLCLLAENAPHTHYWVIRNTEGAMRGKVPPTSCQLVVVKRILCPPRGGTFACKVDES